MLRLWVMKGVVGAVVIREAEIQRRVAEMGAQISEDYRGRSFTAVGILTGCFVFMADLVRHIDASIPVDIQFMMATSYGSEAASSGEVRIVHDLETPIGGKDVLIVEDIVDTGLTLKVVRDNLVARGASSVRIAALLEKETGRPRGITADYVGFPIPDKFVVGYGLDFDHRFRNLKEVRLFNAQ